MCSPEGLFQERVVEEVDLADRQIIGGPPVGIHLAQLLGGEGTGRRGLVPSPVFRFTSVLVGVIAHTPYRFGFSPQIERVGAPQRATDQPAIFWAMRVRAYSSSLRASA